MKQLFKEVLINICIATGIFALVTIFLYFCGLVVGADGHLIDRLLPLELIAGIIGSSYVLIVRNPQNFLGFVVGITMSLLLGIQFYLQGMLEQTLLYYIVFIPCQIYTLYKWIQGSKNSGDSRYAIPSFLETKGFLLMLALFAVIMAAVLLFITNEVTLATVMSAAVVASSSLANLLMIRKRTDAWIYWLVFSVTGIIQMICLHNYVTLTLYVLYLFINGNACIAWCRQTPKENYGWLKMFSKR